MRGESREAFAADELLPIFSAWSYKTSSSLVVVVVNTTSLWRTDLLYSCLQQTFRLLLLLLLLRFVCSRKGVRFLVCFHVGHFLFLFLVVCIEETESMTSAEQLVLELIVPEQRENALLDLSKVRLLFCTPLCVCVCLCIFFFSSFSLQFCAQDFHFCKKHVLRARSWCAQERERNSCPKLFTGFYIPAKETVLLDCCQNLEKLCCGFMISCGCLR
jgi:hypothetical protein